MRLSHLAIAFAAAAAAALTACEARIGNDAPPVAENASAAGRAEDGRVTVEAPGFNMSINIPEGLRGGSNMDDDSDLIYPGSTFGGIHVQGGTDRQGGERGGEVELRFTSGDAIERVVAWYRDPARNEKINIASVTQDGPSFVVSGASRSDNDRFTLRLSPNGSGTEGRLLIIDND
jgi:hypothetical protein